MKFDKWTLGLAAIGMVSLASAVRALQVQESLPTLFERLEDEVRYDCHPTEVAFNRSETKRELLKIGPSVLPALAKHIRKRFPNLATSTMDQKEVNWDMFGVWVWLISSIRREYNLKPSPYPRTSVFGEQDMQRWHDYCLAAR